MSLPRKHGKSYLQLKASVEAVLRGEKVTIFVTSLQLVDDHMRRLVELSDRLVRKDRLTMRVLSGEGTITFKHYP